MRTVILAFTSMAEYYQDIGYCILKYDVFLYIKLYYNFSCLYIYFFKNPSAYYENLPACWHVFKLYARPWFSQLLVLRRRFLPPFAFSMPVKSCQKPSPPLRSRGKRPIRIALPRVPVHGLLCCQVPGNIFMSRLWGLTPEQVLNPVCRGGRSGRPGCP